MPKKFLSVIGTRPQIYKCDPKLPQVIVNTGQHYDDEMDAIPLKEMKLRPKYNLGCDSSQFGMMVDKLRPILVREGPDVVLVYGDTYSTLAGTIAAWLENIKVAHVEAGLRSHDRSMPEETCRYMADHMADYRFAPTDEAMRNLQEEGLGDNSYHVGDPLFWSLKYFTPVKKRKDFGTYVYATIHRRENLTVDNLRHILFGLGDCGYPVFFPMHPHTRRIIKKLRIKVPKNIIVEKPVGRKENIERIYNSRIVVTDSGGVQREAHWVLKPSVVVRAVTEWNEIVTSGWSVLVPANSERIVEAIKRDFRPQTTPNLPKLNPYDSIRDILNA